MTTGSPTLERPIEQEAPPAPEVLFEEARRRRQRRWLRAAGVLLLAAVGTGVGAWISGGSAPRPAPRTRSTTSTAVRTAPAPLCLAPTLTPMVVTHGMGAGTRMLTVTLVSHAARTCRLDGRPTVTVLGRGDVPLPTSESVRETVAGPARTVHVAPGDRVSFYVWMAGRGPTDTPFGYCPILQGLEFTLPPRSGPSETETASMTPGAGSAPIAAYPNTPGGRCDGIGVSVLFPTPPPPPGRASTGGNGGAPAGQLVP